MAFGIPWSLKIFVLKISSMFIALYVDFMGMKCVYFFNLSTTTIIESFCFLVFGNPVIKHKEIISHFHFGMGKGCSNHVRC